MDERPFLYRPSTLVAALVIGLSLLLIGNLSQLGFKIALILKNQQDVNYYMAVILSFFGFLETYKLLRQRREVAIPTAARMYIFIGFAMGGVYYLVHRSHAGCFALPPDIDNSASIIDFVYFSFVTATTIGYGDMVPRHTFVRLLVLLHVLFTMYLVIASTRPGQKSKQQG